jgi:hypothetical protein
VAYPGTYSVVVGSSSRNVKLQSSFDVTGGPLAGFVQPVSCAPCGTASVSIEMPAAGPCVVTARYTAMGAAGGATLHVNGVKVKTVTFPPLANASTWDFETETVDLAAGVNTVSYGIDPGDVGGVDFDAIIGCAPPPASDAGVSEAGNCPDTCFAEPNPADVGCRCTAAGAKRAGSAAALSWIAAFLVAMRIRRRGPRSRGP